MTIYERILYKVCIKKQPYFVKVLNSFLIFVIIHMKRSNFIYRNYSIGTLILLEMMI